MKYLTDLYKNSSEAALKILSKSACVGEIVSIIIVNPLNLKQQVEYIYLTHLKWWYLAHSFRPKGLIRSNILNDICDDDIVDPL